MTETAIRIRAGIAARISVWVSRRQRELSARVHTAADERARQHGWTVTECTGRLGFGARSYRDPRFNNRRQQQSLREQDAAMPAVRQRQKRTLRPTAASSRDDTVRAHGLEQADRSPVGRSALRPVIGSSSTYGPARPVPREPGQGPDVACPDLFGHHAAPLEAGDGPQYRRLA